MGKDFGTRRISRRRAISLGDTQFWIGLVAEYPFSYQRSMAVATERRGVVTPANALKETSTRLVNHPNNIHIPSIEMEITMSENVYKLRDKAGESEKITVNLGYVDLGRIDLLVQEGFYSNRTDFIRTAIRNQLTAEGEAVKQSIIRHTLELGLRDYSRADLEAVRVAGERLHIKVLGLARIASDVTPELALATIESITVLGALQASRELKSALAERIR